MDNPKPEEKPPEPPKPPTPYLPDVGDWVYIVFWRPATWTGNPNGGEWNHDSVRVISVGKSVVCYETPSTGNNGDLGAIDGSHIRMIAPDRVFQTRDDAVAAINFTPPILKRPETR